MKLPYTCMACAVALVLIARTATAAEPIWSTSIGVTSTYKNGSGAINGGGTLGFMSSGLFGFEVDISETKDFFGENLTEFNVMGNLIVGRARGGVLPYGSGGLGLLRSNVGLALERIEDLGMNVGGGIIAFPGKSHFGFRGDVRYFRTLSHALSDSPRIQRGEIRAGPSGEALGFWRVSAGLAFRY